MNVNRLDDPYFHACEDTLVGMMALAQANAIFRELIITRCAFAPCGNYEIYMLLRETVSETRVLLREDRLGHFFSEDSILTRYG